MPVKLEGLPLNVVPICRVKQSLLVEFPNKLKLGINRDQIPLLPNFAMTDYASQGRTREDNPVDIQSCRNFQSMYTCLSRGTSLLWATATHGNVRFLLGFPSPPPKKNKLQKNRIIRLEHTLHIPNPRKDFSNSERLCEKSQILT